MDCSPEKNRWTSDRIARLGLLMGYGWDVRRIANDPIIASRPHNVHRQAQRFGLSFRAAQSANPMRLDSESSAVFDVAANKRGITQETLIRLILLEMAAEPNLIDNVLDDGA